MPRQPKPRHAHVAMAGTVPPENTCGLYSIAEDLMDDPRRLRLAVGIFTTTTITNKITKDMIYPVIQWVHIEAVDPADADTLKLAAGILADLLGRRTGQATLDGEKLPYVPGDEIANGVADDEEDE